MKKNAIHIHTYELFIDETNIFMGSYFDNLVIIFGQKKSTLNPNKDSAIYLNYCRRDLNKAIEICKMADLVVLYGLDFIKSAIANRIPKRIKIIWRFFGYELYGSNVNIFSSLTLKLIKQDSLIKRYQATIHNKIKGFISFVKWWINFEEEKTKCISRIDYFLAFSYEEYSELKKRYPLLPEFIKIPISSKEENYDEREFFNKDIIILGNNRSAYNNHLDIIEIISKTPESKNQRFIIPFSYGVETSYSKAIRNALQNKEHIDILEDFMPFKDYEILFKRAKAFVLNGYRQMALGNIFLCLVHGTKVYLNEKNITLTWLRNEGFYVFPISEFKNDLETNNLRLEIKQAIENNRLFNSLANKYPKESFQKKIYEQLNEKSN